MKKNINKFDEKGTSISDRNQNKPRPSLYLDTDFLDAVLKTAPKAVALDLVHQQFPPKNTPDYGQRGRPLTLKEVETRTGASRTTIYRWRYRIKDDRLRQVKIDGVVRVYEVDLDAFLEEHRSSSM